MGEVTVEMLSAYHDRELGLEETSRLRRTLAADVEARAVLDAFDRIDDAVRESFAEDLDAPISLDLARAVRSGLVARRRRAIGRTVLRWAGPVAAAAMMERYGPGALFLFIAAELALLLFYILYRLSRRPVAAPEERVEFYPVPKTSPSVYSLETDD